eukprot:UN04335
MHLPEDQQREMFSHDWAKAAYAAYTKITAARRAVEKATKLKKEAKQAKLQGTLPTKRKEPPQDEDGEMEKGDAKKQKTEENKE